MAIRQRPDKLGPLTRSFVLRSEKGSVDREKRTIRFSFSSEEPVDMWYGTEILDHSKGAVRLDGARQKNMPLLFNHDRDDLLGVIEGIEISSRKGYCDARFGKDDRGEWAMNQADDGILVNASFLYRVYEFLENVDDEIYTATDWEPYEISLVTIPADASVGIGRAAAGDENAVTFKPSPTPRAPVIPISSRAHRPTQQEQHQMENDTSANGGTGGGAPVMNEAKIRQEAQATERARMQSIGVLGSSLGLGQEWLTRHMNSTVEEAQRDALDQVARQRADADGIAKRERERIAEIEALGTRAKIDAKVVREHVDKKTSVETFRGIVLAGMLDRGDQPTPVSGGMAVDMTRRESEQYSVRGAILAALTGDWSKAGFEREVSSTIQKDRKQQPRQQAAFFMPTNLPFQVKGAPRTRLLTDRELVARAAYAVGGPTTGGNLVETQLLAADFIEVLRNRTVTGQLGARYLTGLVGNINIPRQSAATSTFWVGESAALTESEGTFDQVQLRPHVVGALSKMSRLTLQQTTPAIEMLVREDLLMVEALAIDLAALSGSGSSAQPTGVSNTSGIGSVVGGTNGAALSFDFLIQLYTAPAVANAPQENLGYAINAKSRGFLASLKSTTGQYLWNPTGNVAAGIPDTVLGYRYAVSNQLASNLTKGTSSGVCSMLQFGNWQELFIAEWGVTEVAVNPYDSTGFTTGDVLIRVFQTIDIGLRHPASFAAMSDATTTGF